MIVMSGEEEEGLSRRETFFDRGDGLYDATGVMQKGEVRVISWSSVLQREET